MNTSVGFEGKYRIKVSGPDGRVRRSYEFPNLITDLGLNGIGTNGTSWVTAIALGTGTAAPLVSDTSLSGTVVSTTTAAASVSGYEAGPPPYTYIIYSRVFAQGVATGNWTEIGIGRNSTTLWSRALILDSGGVPTTLTIIATDIVTVEYEFRAYPSTTDVTGTKTISSVSYNYTLRPSSLSAYSNWPGGSFVLGSWMSAPNGQTSLAYSGTIGAITGTPSGAAVFLTNSAGVVAAYSSGSYTKTITWNSTISEGNATGGIGTVRPTVGPGSGNCAYQCGFSPVLPKTNESILSLTFSITWARRS